MNRRVRAAPACIGAACALFAIGYVALPSEVEAQTEERTNCGIFFNEDSCPAEIPRDGEARARVRSFCGALKEASDAVLSGARPGFRMQRGQDWWQGEVSEYRVMWGAIRGRGIYTYDAETSSGGSHYELSFFFPGVSAAELNEGLNVCPAFYLSVVRGNPSTPIVFTRLGREGRVEMLAMPVTREYNPATRAYESGATISLLRE